MELNFFIPLMNNLFSIFDPISTGGLSLNWFSVICGIFILPSNFWVRTTRAAKLSSELAQYLSKEINMSLGRMGTPGVTHVCLSIFRFIALSNFLGLLPYIFTGTSHLRLSLAIALTVWLALILVSTLKDPGGVLAHLVPAGTPYPLMPLMVLIELVRNIIRPITLSVRLAANIVAGHLLLCLVTGPIPLIGGGVGAMALVAAILIMVLESAVAVIQGYVFITLRSLYINDVNSPAIN